MAVSPSFSAFVLEQLRGLQVGPLRAKAMFGAKGIYARDLFFAILDDDRVFFKVDDTSRSRYQASGMGAFDPYGDGRTMEGYYELPLDVLEDPEALADWTREALAVAGRAASRKPRRPK